MYISQKLKFNFEMLFLLYRLIYFISLLFSYFLVDVISSAKEELSKTINCYQKEKAHSDQKVDLLILKVEDLEV